MGGKIIDAQLAEKVKALRDEGKTQEQIAAELRIVQSTVSKILRQYGLGGFVRRVLAARAAVSSRLSVGPPDGFFLPAKGGELRRPQRRFRD
jgi:transcriptional regulator with XRE-family HTH domain